MKFDLEITKTIVSELNSKDKKELLKDLAKDLNIQVMDSIRSRKKSEVSRLTYEEACELVERKPTKLFVEEVAGYFDVSVNTIRHNAPIFRLCCAIRNEPEKGKVERKKKNSNETLTVNNTRRFGRKVPYSTVIIKRLVEFMRKEKINSLHKLKTQIETNDRFKEKVANLKDKRLARNN
jgi:hypothetical protein